VGPFAVARAQTNKDEVTGMEAGELRGKRHTAWATGVVALAALAFALGVTLFGAGAAYANVGSDIDQCANGSGPPLLTTCTWQNGDLNHTNSFYREGDSVPFRVDLTGLTAGSHTLIIQYDTVTSGKHAYDYLTRYDRTITGALPCDGKPVAFCTGSGSDSGLIPLPSNPQPTIAVSGNRFFTIWGGSITSVSNGGATDVAGEQQSVTVDFTSSADEVVVAWSGHVANEITWGEGNAAGAINGSPYHMRIISIDGSGGNQDRAMQSNAVAPLPATFVTNASTGSANVGDSVTDTAALTGTSGAVTGSVQWSSCYSAIGTPDCSVGSTNFGSPVTLVAGMATSPSFSGTSQAGTYCFLATYTPDADSPYSPGVHTNQTIQSSSNGGECFTVHQPAGTLIVKKVVINDNGGTKQATDFSFTINGGSAIAFTQDGSDPLAGKNTFSENPGTYNVLEDGTPIAGYTTTYSGCSNISLTDGGTQTCTITNNDVAGTLIVKKVVINDNGGTKHATDFSFKLDGGSATAFTQDGADVLKGKNTLSVSAGTHSVVEDGTPIAGYSTSYDNCSDVSVANGATQTCTITNNDVAGTLIVKKVVINDNGGTKHATDFSFKLDGGSATAFTQDGADVLKGMNTLSVSAGAHTVVEDGTPISGYTTTYDNCTGVNVANGGTQTCTITNDDIGPTITIQKRLLPSDDAGKFNFTIDPNTQSAIVADNGTDGYGNLGSTGAITVSAGTHTVTESGNGTTNAAAYASTWSCSNEQSGSGTSIALSSLALGQNVTCTFTNTRLATLIVKKVVDNSNGGGSLSASDFTIHVSTNGADLPGSPAAGSSSGTTYSGLMPGTYKVSENAVSGYNLTGITGCLADGSVVLDAGATVTCTLTNKSNAPPPPPPPPPPAPKIDLAITKSGAPNPLTVGNNITWTMVVTNNGPNNATGVNVADPIPAGTTFVSASTSQGSCTGGAMLSCSLGNLNVGVSVTITLVTSTQVTGLVPNTATVVGNEAETNTANNTASASVQVVGVIKPPTVTYCTALVVSPKQMLVGKTHILTIKVSQHGKAISGVKVRIKGATLSITTSASNSQGVVKRTVKPGRAGIVTFVPVAHKSCKNPRVGVIGVFTPPVTG
jgi:uncharacterized repeat protein (TIGR01451 family)